MGGGATPYNSLYGGGGGWLRPTGVPFSGFRNWLQVYKWVGISQVEVYKMVGKSVV